MYRSNLKEVKKNGKFLGVRNTKLGESLELFQFPPELDTDFMNQFYIFYQEQEEPGYHINITFQNNNKWIKIGDIKVPRGSRRGYGTILLQEIENIAIKLEAEKIWGNLDSEDEEHRKIQIAFYKKAGYKIQEEQNYIEKTL